MNKITNIDEVKEIISNEQLCLLYIKTAQCSVCDAVLAQTENMLQRFPKVKSILVSLEETPRVSGEYLVFTAPTLIVFFKGKEMLRESRFVVFGQFERDLERLYEMIGK
ncbi:thioredoxin family protein [Ectobacillus polymachus]|uniref:thioredoxin family protein n=1 Tax=Ectobacillus polymachus TaxID=1508806 RepID=UPI003A881331